MTHDCLEHLEYHCASHRETHGLDCGPYERCYEEWWQCRVCGEKFTDSEVDTMIARLEENTK